MRAYLQYYIYTGSNRQLPSKSVKFDNVKRVVPAQQLRIQPSNLQPYVKA